MEIRAEMIIQEFMPSDFDIRTFCVDNKIFASTKRTHSGYDFRSNTHRGAGAGSPYILSKEEKELVLKSLLEFPGNYVISTSKGIICHIGS